MNNNRITQLKLASEDTDAVNRGYVNTKIQEFNNLFVKKASPVVTANLNMGLNKINMITSGNQETVVVNKKYVDSEIIKNSNLYVEKVGSTMTGNLDMGNNRIQNLNVLDDDDAVSKIYVDQKIDQRVDQKTDKTHNVNYLHYNGNPFLLTKTPIKESSYFVIRQPNNIITTNTAGFSTFDYFTNAELKIKKKHCGI